MLAWIGWAVAAYKSQVDALPSSIEDNIQAQKNLDKELKDGIITVDEHKKKIEELQKEHENLVQSLEDAQSWIWAFVLSGLESLSFLARNWSNIFKFLWNTALAGINFVINIFGQLPSMFLPILKNILTNIGIFASNIPGYFVKAPSVIWNAILSMWNVLISGLESYANTAIWFVNSIISAVWSIPIIWDKLKGLKVGAIKLPRISVKIDVPKIESKAFVPLEAGKNITAGLNRALADTRNTYSKELNNILKDIQTVEKKAEQAKREKKTQDTKDTTPPPPPSPPKSWSGWKWSWSKWDKKSDADKKKDDEEKKKAEEEKKRREEEKRHKELIEKQIENLEKQRLERIDKIRSQYRNDEFKQSVEILKVNEEIQKKIDSLKEKSNTSIVDKARERVNKEKWLYKELYDQISSWIDKQLKEIDKIDDKITSLKEKIAWLDKDLWDEKNDRNGRLWDRFFAITKQLQQLNEEYNKQITQSTSQPGDIAKRAEEINTLNKELSFLKANMNNDILQEWIRFGNLSESEKIIEQSQKKIKEIQDKKIQAQDEILLLQQQKSEEEKIIQRFEDTKIRLLDLYKLKFQETTDEMSKYFGDGIEKQKSAVKWLLNQIIQAKSQMWSLQSWEVISWARANWWPVLGWSSYLVWERWPEIFMPKVSGTIIPDFNRLITALQKPSQTQSYPDNRSNFNNRNITIQNQNTIDVNDLSRLLHRYL